MSTFVLAVHTGAGNIPAEKKKQKYTKLIENALTAGLERFKNGSNVSDAVVEASSVLGELCLQRGLEITIIFETFPSSQTSSNRTSKH